LPSRTTLPLASSDNRQKGRSESPDLFRKQRSHDDLPVSFERQFTQGSGVTEAACKTLVKQRLGGAGMRWTPRGAHVVLQLRAAALTNNRWNTFWRKISMYGVKIEADCAA